MKPFIILVLFVFMLAGCATLSKEECRAGNWYAIGFRDGSEGLASERVEKHSDACESYRVEVDVAQYENGRRVGLKQYCTVAGGNALGATGKPLVNPCPAQSALEFENGYFRGRTKYLEEHLREEAGKKECSFDSDCTARGSCAFKNPTDISIDVETQGSCEIKRSCNHGRCED